MTRFEIGARNLLVGSDGAGRPVRGWVCASHEAGLAGLAICLDRPVGFDLCDPHRASSVRSALPLTLTSAEASLFEPEALGAGGLVRLWAAVEALAKLAGASVLHRRRRAALTGLTPPHAPGVRLRTGRFGPLVGCLATSDATREVPCGSR